ncbi:hypothetical protein H5410_007352 [Solanum commersonii]|uniref:F-box domain-containing protein n=1 Tax=Solanum commersonii TaxID=4109 RepID=A0A9J6ABR6_SOLCO|nr:hypothetical protein H5410_007352 [Solanum commersonii]
MAAKGKGNGKRKGKGKGKGNSKKIKSKPPDPTSDCIFPREIISNILSRLPVKTLLRFRCVCKPWRNLISKPNFIDTHLQIPLAAATNSPILIHTRHVKSTDHVLSLFDSPESSVTELDNPFPFFFHEMAVVGSCNGIVCLCKPPWGDVITLWNPMMRKCKAVQLSKKKPLVGVHSGVSIGLAYDSQENDFIILSHLCFRVGSRVPDEVEMCSTKSFCWKQVENVVGFRVLGPCCNVIIKGVPYWTALVEDKYGLREVLVYFDVDRKVFKKLPMPGITVGTQWQLVNLEDSVAEDENGVLLLFDPVTSSVKAKLCIDNAKRGSSVIFNYSESLVLIGGMLPVEKQTARDKVARENLLKAGINLKIISTDDPQQLSEAEKQIDKTNGKRKGKWKGNSKKTMSKPPDPTSDCIFPREIISNILSRLPAKTLLRFRVGSRVPDEVEMCSTKSFCWKQMVGVRNTMSNWCSGFDRIIGCLRNGDIVADDENGVLLLFDPVTSFVKAKLCIDNAKRGSSVIFNYSENLILIGGMLPVEKQTARDKVARENLLKCGDKIYVFSITF